VSKKLIASDSVEKQSSIKVAHIITGLGVGGAERMVLDLASALELEASIESHLITVSNHNDMLSQYPEYSHKVLTLGVGFNPLFFLKGIHSLIRYIRKNNIEIIHAHMFHALFMSILCKIFLPYLKIIFTSHSFKGFSALRELFIRSTKFLRSTDVLFSERQHPQMNASNFVIIHNGVNITEADKYKVNYSPEIIIFIFVGRLATEKNPEALLKAFSEIKSMNTELWFLGDGPLRPQLEEQINTLGLAARVQLLGRHMNVKEFMSKANCLVMSSVYEGLPMAVLEAGSIGLPVLSTPVGCVPEVLDNNCGLIANIKDFPAILDEIAGNYHQMAKRGMLLYQRICTEYSMKNMVDSHIDLYRKIKLERR
jgi:glycosyltransferase involved in cell wall biosynthesis